MPAKMNPEKIYHVSQTQLSIARFYGGCTYNGDTYLYNPEDDTLTRSDLLKKKDRRKQCLKESPTSSALWSKRIDDFLDRG